MAGYWASGQGSVEPEGQMRSLAGERLQLIAGQSRRIPVQRYLSGLMLAVLLAFYVPVYLPLLWVTALTAGVALRTRLLRRLPEQSGRSDEEKLNLARTAFLATGVLQAVVLGFFLHVPVLIGAVLTIYVIGVCSATLQATAGYRRICVPYTLITMAPVTIAWTLAPGIDVPLLERGVFAALCLLYTTTLLSHARGLSDVFHESYNIRLQRLELNRQMRQALDQARRANQSKTRFLAAASHDLRQPIHALSLFSGSLLLRPMDDRTGAIARQLDQAVQSLSAQMDELLDISRLDAGVVQRNMAMVDLTVLLTQLRDEFEPQARQKGLALHFDCAPGLWVMTDPMLFQRVVRNLLSNAIKYTPAGSVSLGAEATGAEIRVAISDTGPGIPADEQAQVFEEFYQLDNPERDRSKGLGLGLSIVRRLTDLIGIPLDLQSTPGQGTTFTTALPVAQTQDAVAGVESPAVDVEGGRLQVLVVDDEEAIRVGMQTLLDEMGFRVEAAASTADAVEVAQRFRPQVLIADLRLRGDDTGLRTIAGIRALWPDLPALLVSGDTAPDQLREAHDAHITLLHKPVGAERLRDAIVEATRG